MAVQNETVKLMCRLLRQQLPGRRVDWYDSETQNENSVDPLQPGCTVLNKESVKGQEFDAVFLLEIERLLPCTDAAAQRVMYMLCARARDNLFLVHQPGQPAANVLSALPGAELLEYG